MMSDAEREHRVQEACTRLAELLRRYHERDALEGEQRKKLTTFDEARAWLVEKVGERNYTQEETDRRLDEFIETDGHRDAEDSEDEAGKASHG